MLSLLSVDLDGQCLRVLVSRLVVLLKERCYPMRIDSLDS